MAGMIRKRMIKRKRINENEEDTDLTQLMKDIEAEIDRGWMRKEVDTSNYPGMPEEEENDCLND